MNKGMFGLVVFFMLFVSVNSSAQNSQIIPCDDENIIVAGSNYISIVNNELVAHRHNSKVYKNSTKENLFNPLKARTGTGITLSFTTKSPTIVAKFRIIEGLKQAPIFGVFQDDKFDNNKRFKYVANEIVQIKITSKKTNEAVTYTITYPLKTDVHFVGLELEENFQLVTTKQEPKKTYVAFGDSISHGTGQKTTQETYPYILADNIGYELFNTAVGGSKTSTVMAEMIRDDFKHIDMMTVLIGANDFMGEGVSVEILKSRYQSILATIRETHKDTKIYCIVSLATRWETSRKSGLSIEPFIAAIKEVVLNRQKNGDEKIFMIEGHKFTAIEDLKDNVHLSIEGAKSFAGELSKIID